MLDRSWVSSIFLMGNNLHCNSLHLNNIRSVLNVHELHAFELLDGKNFVDSNKRGVYSGHVL